MKTPFSMRFFMVGHDREPLRSLVSLEPVCQPAVSGRPFDSGRLDFFLLPRKSHHVLCLQRNTFSSLSAGGVVMSGHRDYDYWRGLHCEASLIASVLGLLNERWDSAANHMFPELWSGLRLVAMRLADELEALKDEWDRTGGISS